MYKLEQNINNEITAADSRKNRNIYSKAVSDLTVTYKPLKQENTDIDSEKSYEPLLLSCNLKKNSHPFNNDIHIKRNDACNTKKACMPEKSEFILLDKFISNSNDAYKQLTLSEAEQTLNECRQSILNSASPSVLLYASYLLSITGVISLLRARLDDD
ncbi:hypothetical protein [uncultured Clostridium sp.]|uniref:hypothetical protein n=1 Tax=uncultured Clostridium sp. TaxID=59620 RepID=UPI0025D04D0F|nr:hypothetical protein [uncultured Clostridium sp.]